MQPPSLAEGYTGIVTVRSFAAARDAALRLDGEVSLLKFPRTPHLLNFGAATPDDLYSPAETIEIRGPVSIEEKIDGANMGLAIPCTATSVLRIEVLGSRVPTRRSSNRSTRSSPPTTGC